jgi:cell division septum initiation protein DivIVA
MVNRVNLLVLIDQLEALVEKAPEVPLVGKVLVDADELFDLLDIIRTAIPEEVKRAEAVSSERERMISEGQEQVERMIAKAEEYAAKLVSNSEIYRQAEEESKLLIEESRRRAQEMQAGAEEYAHQKLSELHTVLSRALAEIERGQDALRRDDQSRERSEM